MFDNIAATVGTILKVIALKELIGRMRDSGKSLVVNFIAQRQSAKMQEELGNQGIPEMSEADIQKNPEMTMADIQKEEPEMTMADIQKRSRTWTAFNEDHVVADWK